MKTVTEVLDDWAYDQDGECGKGEMTVDSVKHQLLALILERLPKPRQGSESIYTCDACGGDPYECDCKTYNRLLDECKKVIEGLFN